MAGLSAGHFIAVVRILAADILAAVGMSAVAFVAVAEDTPVVAAVPVAAAVATVRGELKRRNGERGLIGRWTAMTISI